MIKQYKRTLILTSVVTMLPLVIGLLLWDVLPVTMATHWGADSTVNGWSSKPMAVLGLPLLLLAIHWVCILITNADPKCRDGKPLQLVLWICPAVSLLCGSLIYAAALGYDLNPALIMPLFIGLLFMVIGNYLPKCQQNYTIGIKVPWTLNSQENWNRTHRFAGIVWVIGGALIMLTCFLQSPVLMIGFILSLAFLPMLYSYGYYLRHEKRN